MKLSELLKRTEIPDIDIKHIKDDSRRVGPGDLFIADVGHHVDARRFVPQAIARGVSAVVRHTEGPYKLIWQQHTPIIDLPGLSEQTGHLASRFHGAPSDTLFLLGVTGTNGKTSVTHFIQQALTACHRPAGIIGTMGYGVTEYNPVTLTTPPALELQSILRGFVEDKVAYAAMEVSSHALAQHRVNGCRFQHAVFTNLTREHLDYHGSMDNYCRSKQKLFTMAERGCIINLDDPYAPHMAEAAQKGAKVWYYSRNRFSAHIHARRYNCHLSGLTLEIALPDGIIAASLPLIGVFNISNVLAAVTTLVSLGFDAERIEKAIAGIQPVMGRMEPFVHQNRPLVVIDYAHTPDALEQSLQAVRQHCPDGRLVCVFGCGGERDRGKRPQMGAIAQKHSDHVIITDDNPRFESPERIIHDIVEGCRDKSNVDYEHDRSMALAKAFQAGDVHDVILIAGKGHETYQVRGDQHIPYSDREQTKRLLRCDSVT